MLNRNPPLSHPQALHNWQAHNDDDSLSLLTTNGGSVKNSSLWLSRSCES